ncbi:MAG: hypothetical protein WC980_00865 [Candidatus Brocadiia bacterium]
MKIIICGILVISAICILFLPLVAEGFSSNEASAEAGLKLLVSTEGIWKQTDVDGNGIKDYWTLDVSCLHRMYRQDGVTKVSFIDISMARSDSNAYSRNNPSPFGSDSENGLDIQDWGSTPVLSAAFTITAKSGYYFRAMLLDENGVPYNQNPVGKNQIKACNTDKFAFVAYPQVAGVSGYYIHIVNETGNIYSTEVTNDENKVILQWPGKDPTKSFGPGGFKWLTEDEYYDKPFYIYLIRSWTSFIPVIFAVIVGVLTLILAGKFYEPNTETKKRNRKLLIVFLISAIPVFVVLVTVVFGYGFRNWGMPYEVLFDGLYEMSDIYRFSHWGGEGLIMLEGVSFLVLSCVLLAASIITFIKHRIRSALFPIMLIVFSIVTILSAGLTDVLCMFDTKVNSIINTTLFITCFMIYLVLLWFFLRMINRLTNKADSMPRGYARDKSH